MISLQKWQNNRRGMISLQKKGWGGTPEFGLILLKRAGLSGDPVRVREFDAPESRRRGEKFDGHALAFVGVVAELDDSTLLLVLGKRLVADEPVPSLRSEIGG